MLKAYILINVRVGTDPEVVEELRRMDHVLEVYEVYSITDIVAKVEANTLEEIYDLVNSRIRKMENVMSTNTLIVAHE